MKEVYVVNRMHCFHGAPWHRSGEAMILEVYYSKSWESVLDTHTRFWNLRVWSSDKTLWRIVASRELFFSSLLGIDTFEGAAVPAPSWAVRWWRPASRGSSSPAPEWWGPRPAWILSATRQKGQTYTVHAQVRHLELQEKKNTQKIESSARQKHADNLRSSYVLYTY